MRPRQRAAGTAAATHASAEQRLGTAAVARRPVGADESQRANRAWWDADADDYLAEHGADIGDVDFVWCPEGLREADARLLGDVRGRRRAGGRLRLGAVRALAGRRRAPSRSALDLSGGHAAPRRRAGRARPASPSRSCRPTPSALPFADGVVRPGLLGVRRGAVRGGLGAR